MGFEVLLLTDDSGKRSVGTEEIIRNVRLLDYWIKSRLVNRLSVMRPLLSSPWIVLLVCHVHTIANFGQLTMEAAMSHSFKDWFCWKVPADQILGSKVASSFSTIFLTRIATFHLHVILTSVSLVSPRIATPYVEQ